MVNSTDLNVHIDDLRPNTEYEFSAKVIKGRRQSTWSLSVLNKTFEAGTDQLLKISFFSPSDTEFPFYLLTFQE